MEAPIGTDITPKNFYTYFKGRTDRVAVYNPATTKVVSLEIKKGDWEIMERVKAHLAGQSRLAIYNHLSDNTCTWAKVSFEEATKVPTAKHSLAFVKDCHTIGLTGVKREKMKEKGENYACWFFFEKPVSAKKIKHLIGLLFKRLDITKADVLPTEDMLTAGSFGIYSWLPYFGGSDKWLDQSGNVRMDLGVKMGHTVFLDENGEAEKAPFAKIRRLSEEDIDNAILYLTEYIPQDPTPASPVKILDVHIKKIMEKCEAMKNIASELKEKQILTDSIIGLLAPIFSAWGRLDYFHEMVSKTKGYDKAYVDKKIASLPASSFSPCAAFREAGLCPEGKECFQPKPPIIERYGRLEDDMKAPKDKWRRFSPAVWAFQGIRERLEDEASAETAIIDIDASDLSDSLKAFGADLLSKREFLMKTRRSYSGISTGFQCLNQSIDGLRPDTVTIVSGIHGIGKGTFCSQIAETCASEKLDCAFVTFGETKNDAIARLISRNSGIDYRRILRGMLSDQEMAKVQETYARIEQTFGPYLYFMEGNDATGIRKMKTLIDALPIKLLVINSLNFVPFISRQQITDIPARFDQNMRQLKTLARYKQIPILVSYTTRDKDSNVSDFVYSETLVMQACDNWIHLEEGKAADAQSKEYHMLIRKNRSGDKNVVYKLAYQAGVQRFVEVK
ncbi:MAG: hypothetical protein MJ234_02030 [bacterium]|nr:hypothetical protein [bacterium]